jgi:threonine 3-dehydrogenase
MWTWGKGSFLFGMKGRLFGNAPRFSGSNFLPPSLSTPTRSNTETLFLSNQTRGVSQNKPRILISGSLGQIGSELAVTLRKKYGNENVIATDIRKPDQAFLATGPFYYLDVLDNQTMNRLVVENRIDWFIHLTSLLSVTGEKNPHLAMQINVQGLVNALETCKAHNCRIFAPSSIAAFGPSTPRDNTPNVTIMQPSTIYGVTKVHLELLGQYYMKRYQVDFRSLRYPGIISAEALPGGGTTDYAVDIFYEALKHGKYTCFLKKDSALPMMFMPDCLKSTVQLLEAPNEWLTQRVYNVTAISFTPEQLAAAIKKYMPHFEISYQPDERQKIADSWPRSLDDSLARKDWKWQHDYDLDKMTKFMLVRLSQKLKEENPSIKLQTLVNVK